MPLVNPPRLWSDTRRLQLPLDNEKHRRSIYDTCQFTVPSCFTICRNTLSAEINFFIFYETGHRQYKTNDKISRFLVCGLHLQ